MNQFDQVLLRNGLGSIGSFFQKNIKDPISSGWDKIKNDPKKLVASVLNPVATAQLTAHQKATLSTINEVQRSDIAKAAALLILNPTATLQYGAEARWAKANPDHAAIAYTVAATLAGGAALAAGNPGSAAIAGGAAKTGAEYAKNVMAGVDDKQARQNALNSAAVNTVQLGLNYLSDTGLDLSSLVNIVGMDKLAGFIGASKLDPQVKNDINRVIGSMRAQGKSDSEIIGELINSQWFKSLATLDAEQKSHAALYQSAYQQLLKMGYDHNTSASVAMQFANKYGAQTAAQGVQQAIQKGPMNFDPKMIFAALAVALPFIMMR